MIEAESEIGRVTAVVVGLLSFSLFCGLWFCHFQNRRAENGVTPFGTLLNNVLKYPQTSINGVSVKNGGTINDATTMTPFSSASVPRATAIPEVIPVLGSMENCRYYDAVDIEKGLLQAIVRSDLATFNLLLARTGKSASDITYWRGMTLMHIAVLAKQSPTTMILALINDHHMSVNVRNENGTTPLMLAVLMNNIPVAEFLIRECSADVNCRDAKGLNVFERNECPSEMMAQLKSLVAQSKHHVDTFGPPYVPENPRSTSTLPPPGFTLAFKQSPQRSGILMTVLLYVWSILMLACLDPGVYESYDFYNPGGSYAEFCMAAGPGPVSEWGLLILGIIYGLYLLEGLFWNATADYLRTIRSSEWSFAKLAAEAAEKPALLMELRCYHRNSEGSVINTHFAKETWEFDEYLDTASDLAYHDGLAKIKIYHKWGFANESTRNEYERAKEKFIRENKRDVHQDFTVKLTFDNKCISHLSLDQSLGAKALSLRFYQLCTVLGCSLWYRLFINANMPKVEIVTTKLLARSRPSTLAAQRVNPQEEEEAQLKQQN